MQRRHVDLIDVWTFLAIDFDVDEKLVHHRGGGVVLETLVRHHMAPMAGRIADREQDWFGGAFCFCQRLRTPRPPRDRIALVLKQIRTRLAREAIVVIRGRFSGSHVFGSGGGPGGRISLQHLPSKDSCAELGSSGYVKPMDASRSTIYALSSGQPPAAIAVVRLCGPHT